MTSMTNRPRTGLLRPGPSNPGDSPSSVPCRPFPEVLPHVEFCNVVGPSAPGPTLHPLPEPGESSSKPQHFCSLTIQAVSEPLPHLGLRLSDSCLCSAVLEALVSWNQILLALDTHTWDHQGRAGQGKGPKLVFKITDSSLEFASTVWSCRC